MPDINILRKALQDAISLKERFLTSTPDTPESSRTSESPISVESSLSRAEPLIRSLLEIKEKSGITFQKPGLGRPAVVLPRRAGQVQQKVSGHCICLWNLY